MIKISELTLSTSGDIFNFTESDIDVVSTDSRSIKKGAAFLALTGDNFDGHDFIKEVARKGASCLIVSKKWFNKPANMRITGSIPVIAVDDTLKALGDIAHFHRMKFSVPVIGITGSNGKTTTKELVAYLLSEKFNVLKTEGTKNNLIGLPQTMLNLNASYGACVVEMGTNIFGEIKRLSEIASPDIGVITNVGPSHLECFKTLNNVFKTKFDLIKALPSKGVAVLNRDDKYLARAKTGRKTVYFGIEKKSDYSAGGIVISKAGLNFKINNVRFKIPVIGRHNVYNVLAAVAVAGRFGISLKKCARRLAGYVQPFDNRLCLYKSDNISIINDCYNSSPVSFEKAIESLAELSGNRKRVIICSDMLELGDRSEYFHKRIGRIAAHNKTNRIVTFGPQAEMIGKAAISAGVDRASVFHFDNKKDLIGSLERIVEEQSMVLVKGSRRMKMEEVTCRLKELFF